MPFSTNPPLELVPSYGWALFAFGFAAWLEALAEPFVIVSLKFTMDTQYAIVQGLLVVMQRVVVIALLLLTSMPHIVVFCYAHVSLLIKKTACFAFSCFAVALTVLSSLVYNWDCLL
ncbi:hypothetical protein Tcan_02056 [Toxocara canis]|uniref:Protein RFT1 homolog n=1 Tax=Toxocara canis TaxID=6265 RepID=A0A0B2ULA2_TOXCA|nr:hypothetical protein Tcan_02056 [Toxocara canis]